MTDNRHHAHPLVDRLPGSQLSALVGLLETIVDPVAAALRDAPLDDEEESEDERAAVRGRSNRCSEMVVKASRMAKQYGGWVWIKATR